MLVSVGIKNDLGRAFSSLQKLSSYMLKLMVDLQPKVMGFSCHFSCYGIIQHKAVHAVLLYVV